MSYQPFEWRDVTAENPAQYRLTETDNTNRLVNLVQEFGAITGTPISSLRMNTIENGIYNESLINVQQTLLLLDIISRLNEQEAYDFIKKHGGLGFFEDFADTSEIDLPNTTTTFVNGQAVFTGSQKLTMKEQVFTVDSTSATMNIYSDVIKNATVTSVVDPSNIVASTNGYELTINDKLLINDSEVGILSVSGGQSNVVYTNEVTNAQNNTSGKNAVQFNGLRHFVTRESTGLKLYRADDATTETLVASISTDVTSIFSVSVATVGSNEFLFVTWGIGTQQKIIGYATDYSIVQAETVVDTVTSVQSVDLSTNNIILGICNTSIISTHSLSSNMRAIKYTINTNGSLTVNGTNIQISKNNAVNTNYVDARCVFSGSVFTIISPLNLASSTAVDYLRNDGTLTVDPVNFDGNFSFSRIVNSVGSKKLSIKVKETGTNLNRIFVSVSTTTIIMYYSDDEALNWNNFSVGTGSNPQLTENLAGDIHITYEDAGAIKTIEIPNGTTTPSTDETLVARVGEEYYTLGDEEIPTSGGYSSTNSAGTVTNFIKQATQLNLQALAASGTALAKRVVASELAVDVTNLSRLYVDWTHSDSSNNSGHGRVFALTQTRTSDYNVANAVSLTGSRNLARSTQSIDVSGLTGSYFIKLAVFDSSRVGGSTNTLLVHNIFSSSIVNPKSDGQATDYIKPVCTYDGFGLAGEEVIGAGFNIELESSQTTSINDELLISTQFAPKEISSNPNIDLVYASSTSNSIQYNGQTTTPFTNPIIEINSNGDGVIDRFVVALS